MAGEKLTQRPITLGVTGASGAIVAKMLLDLLRYTSGQMVECIFTENAEEVWRYELQEELPAPHPLLRIYRNRDLFAPPASGSHASLGMVIAPCSMGTLGKIAHGIADNLLTRAADVTLKEGRRLILVPRESPLSPIHLENMLRLANMGVVIMPPMLCTYHRPESIEQMVKEFVEHIAEQLGLDANRRPWGGEQ